MNDLSLHIIDIIQNSISAGATLITLRVEEDTERDLLVMEVGDNGRGMTQEQVEKLSDPFFTTRTTRRVGMGIPLFRQSAEQAGGSLEVISEVGKGTTVRAEFGLNHIDRPPMGDIANSFILMVSANPELDFVFDYTVNGQQYLFDTREVKEALDGISLAEPAVIRMLTEMVSANIDDLRG